MPELVWFDTYVLASLSDMLAERRTSVNRSTIYHCFIEYDPVLRKKSCRHQFIQTDSSYANAINRLKMEGRLRADVEQRQMKYLNDGIEPDHASIKKLTVVTSGFKERKRVWLTLQGSESLRMINKGQFDL